MERLRIKIDTVHDQIFQLFIERVQLTENIWAIKYKEEIQLNDLPREQDLIHRHDLSKELCHNVELKLAYQEFISELIRINKNYLNLKHEKLKNEQK